MAAQGSPHFSAPTTGLLSLGQPAGVGGRPAKDGEANFGASKDSEADFKAFAPPCRVERRRSFASESTLFGSDAGFLAETSFAPDSDSDTASSDGRREQGSLPSLPEETEGAASGSVADLEPVSRELATCAREALLKRLLTRRGRPQPALPAACGATAGVAGGMLPTILSSPHGGSIDAVAGETEALASQVHECVAAVGAGQLPALLAPQARGPPETAGDVVQPEPPVPCLGAASAEKVAGAPGAAARAAFMSRRQRISGRRQGC